MALDLYKYCYFLLQFSLLNIMKSRSSSSQTTLISTHSPSSQRQANLTISDAKLDHEEKNGNKKSPSKKRSANDSSKAASSPKTSPKVQKIKVSSPPSSPASSFSQSNPNEDIVKILKGMTSSRNLYKINNFYFWAPLYRARRL